MTQTKETNFEILINHIEYIKKILNKKEIDINQNGSVFFSGYGTLLKPNGVYLIGLNPGGDFDDITISKSLDEFLEKDEFANAYLDENWGKESKNEFQKNAVDAFEKLNLCLRETCGSNIIFQRTKNRKEISKLTTTMNSYVYCHDYIINNIINPSVIITVGADPYGALKNNWCDEKGKELPLNTNSSGKAVKGSPWYIESKDGDKILCYLPHFSRKSLYEKFSKCDPAIEKMHSKIHEKLKLRYSCSKLPKWKFKNSCQSLLPDIFAG